MTIRDKVAIGMVVGAVLCVLAWLIHRDGVEEGRADQTIEQLDTERKEIALKTARDARRADSLKKVSDRSAARSDSSRSESRKARASSDSTRRSVREASAKVVLRGDTAIVGEKSQIMLPEISSMIRITLDQVAKDSVTIAKQAATISEDSVTIKKDLAATIAAKDTVIADHVAGDKKADEQIDVLQKEKRPRFGIKTGIAVGVAFTIAVIKAAALVIK